MKWDIVSLRELEAEGWGEGTFEMDVQLYFGKCEEEWIRMNVALGFPGLEGGVGYRWIHLDKLSGMDRRLSDGHWDAEKSSRRTEPVVT